MTDKKQYYGIPDEKKKRESHEGHHVLVTMTTGPHYAKLICATCGGKFVKWLNREQYQMYK